MALQGCERLTLGALNDRINEKDLIQKSEVKIMKVGLVLAGGMAKGAYEMGALKAIRKYFAPEDIASISCSSIGVLNGYAFASDKLDRAEKMWRDISKNGKKHFVNTVLRSSFLQQSITDLESEQDTMQGDFYISLLNFRERTLFYHNIRSYDPELYPDFLRASVAMPLYNRAVKINNHFYYDGAMVDNIPVYPLLEKDLDYIIVVYFDNVSYIFENMVFDKKVLKLIYPTKQTIMDSFTFEEKAIDQMISRGFDHADRILYPIFEENMQDKSEIYAYIKKLNSKYGSKEVRVTGDMLVTNLNRVVNKLAKRKVK